MPELLVGERIGQDPGSYCMSYRVLRAIEDGKVKIGAGGGLTVAAPTGGAQAATPGNPTGDLCHLDFGDRSRRAERLGDHARDEWNEKFYGHPLTVQAILKKWPNQRACEAELRPENRRKESK